MVPLSGWVTLHPHTSYRSPRQIVDMLASIGEARQPVNAASPFEGADIEALRNKLRLQVQTARLVADTASRISSSALYVCNIRG